MTQNKMGQSARSRWGSRLAVLATVAVIVALAGCTLLLQPPAASIEEELGRAIDLGFDGIIVHVNQSGTTASYSAGWDDRESLEPADPTSLFKIASISKLYIAAATTMLVADGTLSLETTLDLFLPSSIADRIQNAGDITLRMLLQHRSGIPDYVWNPDYPFEPLTVNDDTYQYFLDQPADFRPGSRYAYSNSNYFLIGEILDDALGYSHHTYIQDEILTPLGLSNTYLLLSDVASLDDVMSGYIVGYPTDFKDQVHIQPGGSMVATADDVAVFVRALVDGTLFTFEEQAIYTSVYEYEHTGWVPGYTSIVRYHSDIDAVVVQFVNTSSDQLFWLDLERMYGSVIRVLERNPL